MKTKGRLYMVKGGHTDLMAEGSVPSYARTAAVRETQKKLHVTDTAILASAWQSAERRLNGFLEDRQRMARDLHDCVLQSLYAVGLTLGNYRRLNSLNCLTPDELSYGINQTNTLIGEVRRMVRKLEEDTIQPFNLLCELESLVTAYQNAIDVPIELKAEACAVEELTQQEKHELFSIAREAVSNSVRHAKARHITIALTHGNGRILLSISDDGIGFSVNQRPTGYGLFNMTTLIQKLGGTLHIQSEIGQGTTIIAVLDLEPISTPV